MLLKLQRAADLTRWSMYKIHFFTLWINLAFIYTLPHHRKSWKPFVYLQLILRSLFPAPRSLVYAQGSYSWVWDTLFIPLSNLTRPKDMTQLLRYKAANPSFSVSWIDERFLSNFSPSLAPKSPPVQLTAQQEKELNDLKGRLHK